MEDNLTRYLDTESSEGSGNREFAKEISITPSAVVRIVEPQSVIKCWRMWPLCDDGKKRSFVIGNEYEGDSLLGKMLGDYLPYKYFKGGILESEKDELTGQKRYIHEAKDPELFLQLIYNGDKSGNNGSWRPTREFIFNAIDRSPETKGDFMGQLWCALHKHTKLLKMPITGFEKLKTLIEQHGQLDEYDLYYTKIGSGRTTKHDISKAGEKNALAFFGFLTDEEKLYEKYDLKKECALSSATYILKYLSMTIQRIDNILGTNFFDQLVAQSQLEKEAWGIADEGAVHDAGQILQQTMTSPQLQTPIPQVNQQSVSPAVAMGQALPQQAIGTSSNTPITPIAQVQPQTVPPVQVSATPVSQQVLTRQPATAVAGRVPVNASSVPTINCPYCQTNVPEDIEVCPQCSNRLMEPCRECNTMFSILSTKCPNEKCGAVYKLG
jgi:hypothetical protein